jgi:hypothetical protein
MKTGTHLAPADAAGALAARLGLPRPDAVR